MADAASSPMADGGGDGGGGANRSPPSKQADSVGARYKDLVSADAAQGGGGSPVVSPLTKRSVYRPIDSPRASTAKLGSPNFAAETSPSMQQAASGSSQAVQLPNISSPATGGADVTAASAGGSPQLPPIGAAAAPSDNGGYAYKPAIYLERRSAMGTRPLISGA